MKKIVFISLLLVTVSVFGQRKGKITGNKEVVETRGDLDAFHGIEVGDELEVSINQGATSSYTLLTDENLVDSVIFQVKDSILSIYTSNKITRSKKLDILVNTKSLDKIMLSNKAKLSATSTIRTDALMVDLKEGSELEMDVKADSLTMSISNNSRADFQFKGDRLEMNMVDNAFAKADINTATFHYNATGRVDAELKGVAMAVIINSQDSAEFKGKGLNTDVATIVGSGSTNINIFADKDVDVDLKDKAQLYLYGKPEVKVTNLSDEAEILKRD
ncbi:hypothetical protein EAX61_12750 [Dokdonia sinensis]|uniref:Putative auto-transporter adhesin head GIN domain-containing protein n=1 Tax=Dokdonia sinensis TaxID=2479847 RepID=A0A3M0GHW2_9FLAO|nr:DUF2807 domain-containing protein [Dokdonia sinensis]RMB56926.1 hypothetical protein EAX61_12750 [Dokdonia sinensis]